MAQGQVSRLEPTNVISRNPFFTDSRIAYNVAQTPIPGALPLFASVLGMFGFVRWIMPGATPATA
jgi:hypothetical protein